MATHQGPTQEIQSLLAYAEPNAAAIIKYIDKDVVLCYSGMSGTALATAVFIELSRKKFKHKVGMVFVRKEDEPSNSGNKLHHHQGDLKDAAYIFVDDQISNKAKTFHRVEKGIQEIMPSRIYGFYDDERRPATAAHWKAFKMDYALLTNGLFKFVPKGPGKPECATTCPTGRCLESVQDSTKLYRW